jgi:hypothetical protein
MKKPKEFWRTLVAIFKVWGWPASIVFFFAFLVTCAWLWDGLHKSFPGLWGQLWWPEMSGWFEPLALILVAIGGLFLAQRRILSREQQDEAFDLARGLALAYYYNFVQPVSAGLAKEGIRNLKAVIVGMPARSDLDRVGILAQNGGLDRVQDKEFNVEENSTEGLGRKRQYKLVTHVGTEQCVVIDVPTVLAPVIFFAEHADRLIKARQEGMPGDNADVQRQAAIDQLVDELLDSFRTYLESLLSGDTKATGLRVHVVNLSRLKQTATDFTNIGP